MDSLKRILNFVKRELTVPFALPNKSFFGDKNTYSSSGRWLFGAYSFTFLMGLVDCWWQSSSFTTAKGILYGGLFTVAFALMIMREYLKKTNRAFVILLPASVQEKFAAKIIAYYVIIPLTMLVGCTLCYYIGALAGGFITNGQANFAFDWEFFAKVFNFNSISIGLMCMSALFLITSLVKNEIVQVILGVAVILLLMPLSLLASVIKGYADWLDFSADIATYLVYPLISLMFLTGSYIKFKKERA